MCSAPFVTMSSTARTRWSPGFQLPVVRHHMADVPRILERRRGLILGMSARNSVGYHCATALTALGAEVAATYRPSRRDVCGPLAEEAGCTLHFGVDVEDEDSLAAAFQTLRTAWGRLDFLVHTLVHVPAGV